MLYLECMSSKLKTLLFSSRKSSIQIMPLLNHLKKNIYLLFILKHSLHHIGVRRTFSLTLALSSHKASKMDL